MRGASPFRCDVTPSIARGTRRKNTSAQADWSARRVPSPGRPDKRVARVGRWNNRAIDYKYLSAARKNIRTCMF